VFNHIPKTAGVAITVALEEAVEPKHPFIGIDRFILGSNSVQALSAVARRGLLTAPEEIPADTDLVYGHISPATTRARFPQATEMTILREPRARLLSHWLFFRTYQDFMLRGWGTWADDVKAARVPLRAFLGNARIAYYTDNLITRFLVAPHDLVPVDDFIDEADDEAILQSAFGSLDRFAFVDVLEDPDLAGSLSKWFGREVRIGRANETQPMPPSRRCDVVAEAKGATDLLEARTRLDAKLWDRVALQAYLAADAAPASERQRIFGAAVARHEQLADQKGPGVLTRAAASSLLRLRFRASAVKHYIKAKRNAGVYGSTG
jgi:hypothetical protein